MGGEELNKEKKKKQEQRIIRVKKVKQEEYRQ